MRLHFRSLLSLWLIVLLMAPSVALAEQRVVIEHVSFDDKTMELTLHADVLDSRGVPVEEVRPEDLEITASNQKLEVSDVSIETSAKAGEPIAVVLLISAANAYHRQGSGESSSTFKQAKEGAALFIGELGGNDKVAVLMYREGEPHEKVYTFSNDHKQAKETVLNWAVPDRDVEHTTAQGDKERERDLSPHFVQAVDKALDWFQSNLSNVRSARRRFLIVMSDGKDRDTNTRKITRKFEEIQEKYAEYKIRIHAIGYTADDPQYLPMLQTLANNSGGMYRLVTDKEFSTIPTVWSNIAKRLKKQLIIKAKLASLPDHGQRIKGKDLANYVIGLKVTMKDEAVEEAIFNDVQLPLRGFDWKTLLKWIGIVVGGLLAIGLVIGLIVLLARRRGGGGQGQQQVTQYEGPDRGKLYVRAGPLAGQVLPLIDDVTTIGSIKGNTLVIEGDSTVSRRHAAIKIDQMRYEIADINSANGTYVNGGRVHKVFLRDGDKINIGLTELEFRLK